MNKFKNILVRITLFAVVLSIVSCKKYLDLKPENGIIRENFWKTKEQLQSAVIGCYSSLLAPPPGVNDRALPEYLFLWGEMRGDMIATTTNSTGEDIEILNGNIQPSNSIVNWRSVYRTINYCNTVIEFGPQVLQNDKTLTQQALNAYLAEAKALRALMYFYLVRSFSDVPLVLTATSSDSKIQQLPKSTQAEVLAQILKDLDEAEADVAVSYGFRTYDKGRITRYTVNAIQADVNLWMDQYDACITACNKIINSNQFGLVDGSSRGSWFSTVYVSGNSNESIFEFQYDRVVLNTFYNMLRSRARFVASATAMEEVFPVDMRTPDSLDIRGDGSSLRFADGGIWKYIGVDDNTARTNDASYAHWFVYRYPDVLLMKAEALAQSADQDATKGQAAIDLIKQVRNRLHLPAGYVTERTPAENDKDAITDYILEERAREFAYEGKRWYDLLRVAKRNNYARLELLVDVVSKSVPGDRQQSAINKIQDKRSHYFPIYEYELSTDDNLVQNPFYQ